MTSHTWHKTFYMMQVTSAGKFPVLHKLTYPALSGIKTKAGNTESWFRFGPHCTAHANFKATFSEKRCTLETCKYGNRYMCKKQLNTRKYFHMLQTYSWNTAYVLNRCIDKWRNPAVQFALLIGFYTDTTLAHFFWQGNHYFTFVDFHNTLVLNFCSVSDSNQHAFMLSHYSPLVITDTPHHTVVITFPLATIVKGLR